LDSFGWGPVLELAQNQGFRLPRLVLQDEEVDAEVAAPDEPNRSVMVSFRPFSKTTWEAAIQVMANRARFAATLLSGHMPGDIESAFEAAGQNLLPTAWHDICTTCTCAEPKHVCRHQAYVLLVLGERFERDPFLFFQLRGRPREVFLKALRLTRSGLSRPGGPASEIMRLPLEPLPDVRPEAFQLPQKPIAQLRSMFPPMEPPDAILTRLGPPPFQDAEASRLLIEFHRAVGAGAKEKLSEWEWRRILGRSSRNT
jgi:uncharacterized Zn finger protein